MPHYAVIVAGGRGLRMQTELPKQFLDLCGKPVLMHTISAFAKALDSGSRIILVLPEDHIPYWKILCSEYKFQIPHEIVKGGRTRFESVQNGLNACPDDGTIGIHDGVRPLISGDLIRACFIQATEKSSALPVVAITQSLRKIDGDESHAIDRDGMLAMQTPQCFKARLIKQAYNQEYSTVFTDDATVFEAAGNKVELIDGDVTNIKITTPQDMKIAEAIIGKPAHG